MSAEGNETREWVKVAEANDLEDRRPMVVEAAGKTFALTLVDGEYFALENSCPHQGGPLGEGSIDDSGRLSCPWHGWRFCLRDGKGDDGADAESFPVEARDDGVYIEVPAPADAQRTVSDVMVETLVEWGIAHVFGMVGHSNLGLAEALRRQEEKGNITFIGIRHEGAAAMACSGYAKASGKPAACLTIAGPGATNLLTGLWDAKVDQAPVLALTGQVQTQVLGPGAFQEIDLASAFAAVADWSQTVLAGSDHGELAALAMKNAIVNRSVAHLIFPDEVQVLPVAESPPAHGPEGRLGRTRIAPDPEALDQALELLGRAKRPAIVVGFGAKHEMDAVIALAERLQAPVLTTFKAKGQIADDHPLATGVLGRSGTPVAASCMTDADLLVVFGASFAVHTGIDKSKPIVQVDFDRMKLGKFHPVDAPVWGEIGTTARLFLERLPTALGAEDQRPGIARHWAAWREEKARRAAKDNGQGMSSAAVFAHLGELLPEDAVIAVDVGNNTYSFGRYFECQRQSVLMSGYLGSIGFGFPAAMGARMACPDRPVVCIAGDGGFGQYMAEFTTAVKYAMDITLIVLNNHELGKISKEQRAGHWPVWQTALHNPGFAEFAENCGGLGLRVEAIADLDDAIKAALDRKGPALVELITDAELI